MGFLLLISKILAELVQMKEKYPNTGLKKAFIKQSSFTNNKGYPLDCSLWQLFSIL
jgi:hypothetical protein